jgi:hypothetical protein
MRSLARAAAGFAVVEDVERSATGNLSDSPVTTVASTKDLGRRVRA